MEKEKFLAAVYMIIMDDHNRVLLQRRQGTKLWPGHYALPAGVSQKFSQCTLWPLVYIKVYFPACLVTQDINMLFF